MHNGIVRSPIHTRKKQLKFRQLEQLRSLAPKMDAQT